MVNMKIISKNQSCELTQPQVKCFHFDLARNNFQRLFSDTAITFLLTIFSNFHLIYDNVNSAESCRNLLQNRRDGFGFRKKIANVACHAIIFGHSHSITTHEYVQQRERQISRRFKL